MLLTLLAPVNLVRADDFTSTNFILRDPVLGSASGTATSSGFESTSTTGQNVIGENSSASFSLRSGFDYFPTVTTPVITAATAGDAQVTLTWTTALGTNGFNVSAYEVGQATVSGGPFSFTNVGNVTTSVRTGLTNGTTYFFVIRALDAFASPIVTSAQASATPVAAVVPPPPAPAPSGGGGGGGGSPPLTTGGIVFLGTAYPGSKVVALKDAQQATEAMASSSGSFEMTLSALSAGSYAFLFSATDAKSDRSTLLPYSTTVIAGGVQRITDIIIPPTLRLDKVEVRKGDPIEASGYSASQAEVVVSLISEKTKTETVTMLTAGVDGSYRHSLPTTALALGTYSVRARTNLKTGQSAWGSLGSFTVGDKNVVTPVAKPACPPKGDLNGDCRVNIVDFSIAAFWFKRPLTDVAKTTVDLNLVKDGAVDLKDFSVMAYYWTG